MTQANRSIQSTPADALVESEAKIRAILDTAVDGIITIDERGIIESYNPAAQRLFGYRPDEVIGRNVSMLMPEPYQSEHDAYLRSYLVTGRAKIIGIGREVWGLRKDGGVFPMDLAVSEVRFGERRLFTGIVRDLTERKRMERELLEISDREQRRIGQDLHDGLGQVLAGVGFLVGALQQRLEARNAAEADDARQIGDLVVQAITHARGMSHGLHPVRPVSTGLMTALEELAIHVERVYRITCTFRCDEPVLIEDAVAATHLYRIAQEAVNNAIKHGRARHVTVALARRDGAGRLVIADDGTGFTDVTVPRKGMGLHIMRYRAAVVGGKVQIGPGAAGGTVVACTFPTDEGIREGDHEGNDKRGTDAAQQS